MKVSEKLHKAVNGKCPKMKPGTLERVKLKTEVLLKEHLTVVKVPKTEPIEDTEENETGLEGEEENKSAGLLIRLDFKIFGSVCMSQAMSEIVKLLKVRQLFFQ